MRSLLNTLLLPEIIILLTDLFANGPYVPDAIYDFRDGSTLQNNCTTTTLDVPLLKAI